MTTTERQAVIGTCAPFALLTFVTPWMDSPLAAILTLCVTVPALLITGMAIATPTEEPHHD
jgi:hypothetical protein